MTRLWDKGAPLDERVLEFTAGEDYALDERLVAYDVRASIAHAGMLRDQNLLTAADFEALRSALEALADAHARGEWRITLADEDGQSALEQRLTERLGAVGGRIHLGRSRNDQVLTALRLYLKDVLTLDALAARQGNVALPGYTHMQQAMPSSVTLWAGGFAAELRDDAEGLRSARRRVDKNPLGSAAGYGAPGLPLDREATSRALGFASTHQPVTAVQLARGKAESGVLFECTLLMQDLAFIEIPDAFTTGSSIMPQKRNPDVFELLRGRSAVALAALAEALALYAKLPSGYQRDLQLLKAPLFRGIDQALQSLDIAAAALAALVFRPERIRLDPTLHAAEEAYALVLREGIPFRDAYRRIAERYKKQP